MDWIWDDHFSRREGFEFGDGLATFVAMMVVFVVFVLIDGVSVYLERSRSKCWSQVEGQLVAFSVDVVHEDTNNALVSLFGTSTYQASELRNMQGLASTACVAYLTQSTILAYEEVGIGGRELAAYNISIGKGYQEDPGMEREALQNLDL
jgi:hypothetical protein